MEKHMLRTTARKKSA